MYRAWIRDQSIRKKEEETGNGKGESKEKAKEGGVKRRVI